MSTLTYPQIVASQPQQFDLIVTNRQPLMPNQIAGKTVVTLVSPGTEIAFLSSSNAVFPMELGYASVFQVEEVGNEATGFAPGDYAFFAGKHAGWQQCCARDAILVPKGLDPSHAVCARLMGVTMTTLTTTAARPPEPVAVTGLGPVGHLGAQLFQMAGYDVTAVDPMAERRADAQAAGISKVAAVLPADAGFALVVDCSGHEGAVLDACRSVRKGGEVVLVGVPWSRKTETYAFDVLHAVFHGYVRLRSGWEWEVPVYPEPFQHNSIQGNTEGAMRWISEGRIKLDGLTAAYSPNDANKVYDDLRNHRYERLSTQFDWTRHWA